MKIPEILMVETVHQPGSLARVLGVIAEAGLFIDHLNAVRREQGRTLWEITLEMDEDTDRGLYARIDALPTARFVGKSDRVFDRHRGGKLRTRSSIPNNTQQVLRDIYTPGVARVCLAIRNNPELAWQYTSLDRTVAVITNGTAVVVLAALHNATRRVGRRIEDCVIGQVGLGAAGLGIVRLLRYHGAVQVKGADRNPAALERLRALERGAAFAADGKGINNVLGFPGLFKGALEARARRFSDEMLIAAAHSIAALAHGDDLVPDPLDRNVHAAVTEAVREAALIDRGAEQIEALG